MDDLPFLLVKVGRDFNGNIKKQYMKKMMDIFLEPLRNADDRAMTVIKLALVAVTIGCMVAAVDSVIVYLMSLALLYTIMSIISDCEEGGDDDA